MGKPVYDQVFSGVPFDLDPDRYTLHLACCDCGLVHNIAIVRHRKSRKLTITMVADGRATSLIRRAKGSR
jgi:hypothetical protein